MVNDWYWVFWYPEKNHPHDKSYEVFCNIMSVIVIRTSKRVNPTHLNIKYLFCLLCNIHTVFVSLKFNLISCTCQYFALMTLKLQSGCILHMSICAYPYPPHTQFCIPPGMTPIKKRGKRDLCVWPRLLMILKGPSFHWQINGYVIGRKLSAI
jgi:hypothetical protein